MKKGFHVIRRVIYHLLFDLSSVICVLLCRKCPFKQNNMSYLAKTKKMGKILVFYYVQNKPFWAFMGFCSLKK